MQKEKPQYLKYSDVSKIIKENRLQYLIMIGQRSNGKSYAAKELAIRNAFKQGTEFCYLRRRKEDIQDYMISEYFADLLIPEGKKGNKIEQITKGKFNSISIYRKGIYLSIADSEKTTRGQQIGYAHALSGLEGIKSRQFPKVDMIIYEEFIATGLYLWEEPEKLQQYTSSIFRTRPGCVIMIGNTISRIVPYFTEWQLDGIPRQKQGTVDIYKFHTDDTETRIGVFLCGTLQLNSGMFFGQAAKMIVGGEWDRSVQPRPEHDPDDYAILYTMVFDYSEQTRFLLQFLQLKSDHTKMLWYVQPKTSEIHPGTRVVKPAFSSDRLYTMDFDPINEREAKILSYFKEGKIAYSDNLTGTEFKRCLEQMRKR